MPHAILSSEAELDDLPNTAVILTGDHIAMQKVAGVWKSWHGKKGSPSALLLDPDFSRPPILLLHPGDPCSALIGKEVSCAR